MSEDPNWFYNLVNGRPVPFPAVIAERIFNRDAIDPSVPLARVRWRTGEATFEPQVEGCGPGEICGLHIENFSCVVLLERLYELLAEVGGVYMSTAGFLVAREDARGCFGPGHSDDGVVATSLDAFIDLASVIFRNCGPDADLRTA